MTDKTPDREDNQLKEEKSIRKDNDSPEINRDVNELRNKDDLLNWLDDSPKVTRRSKQQQSEQPKQQGQKQQPANRRRTTIVGRQIPDELRDIIGIGKGHWVEAPTPEQINQIQSTTPSALKYLIDLVSSLSSVQSTSQSSSSSSPSGSPRPTTTSPGGSPRVELTPELVQQRIADTRRLFLDPVLAELEEHQLKFALIILVFVIILIHLAISLLSND